MFGEIVWFNLDRLATHYSAVRAHSGRIDDLSIELSTVCDNLEHRTPSLFDFSRFFSSRTDRATEAMRTTAWLSQHLFNSRAWCVGQKVVECNKRGKISSALLGQLAKLGANVDQRALESVKSSWDRLGIVKQDRLDCLLYDAHSSRISLVKGQLASQAARISKFSILKNSERNTLFGPSKAFMCDVFAKTESIAALLYARDVIAECVSNCQVDAFFITAEDHGGSGRFQAHRVASADLDTSKTRLDDFEVVATHEDYPVVESDPECLLGLPDTAEPDFLKKAPVDLPVRSVMILKCLANMQRSAVGRLVLRRPKEIAEAVSTAYRLHYPTNMARHDIDRLQMIGLLNWSADDSGRLGLTAAGIFRVHLLEHRFNRLLPRNASLMLEAIEAQEQLWLTASKL